MKLSRIASLLAGAGVLAAANVALASEGTIHFTGEIQASTCVVDHANPHSQTVGLLPVNATAFTGTGSTAGWQQFEIKLKDCSGATYSTARAIFESGTTVNAQGRLYNTDETGSVTGAATGVELQLRQAPSGQLITIGSPTQAALDGFDIDTTAGTATMRYEAGYYAADATAVTPGSVASSVTYSVNYE